MIRRAPRHGSSNSLYVMIVGSIVALTVLVALLFYRPADDSGTVGATGGDAADGRRPLFMYCAAGMQYAMEEIVANYKQEYGVSIQLQYGGSNTLLNQLEVSKTGDLYLAADESYIRLAEQKGLIVEALPVALMKPVIAVRADNPKNVQSIADLLRDDVKVALGDPGAAAVGKKARRLLSASGHWAELERHATSSGVIKPTVNDVANAVKLGSVDAGIIWDSTAAQYKEVKAIAVPELDAGLAMVEIAVVANSKQPTAALRFARYVAARNKGLESFRANGFKVIDGDLWEDKPQITLFAGAVNRAALDPIIKEFAQREDVTVNTVFDGCGILTARMRGITNGKAGAFPDVYMACDVYYLKTVDDLFQDAVNVSDTDIVIVTQKGNPKNIRKLSDLLKPGVRVVLGQPDKCTIGVLSKRLLESEGIYQQLAAAGGNLVTQTTSSALLVPQLTTGAADAVLAYRTDSRAESNRLEVIEIDSQLAKAIQPFSVARSSDHKYLGRRLFDKIAQSRDKFESQGFNWRLDQRSGGDGGQAAKGGAPASGDARSTAPPE